MRKSSIYSTSGTKTATFVLSTLIIGRYTLSRVVRGLITMWLVVTTVFVVLRRSGAPAQALLSDDTN